MCMCVSRVSAHVERVVRTRALVPSVILSSVVWDPPPSHRLLFAEAHQFSTSDWTWINAGRVLDEGLTRGGWLNFCRDHKILPLAESVSCLDTAFKDHAKGELSAQNQHVNGNRRSLRPGSLPARNQHLNGKRRSLRPGSL